MGLLISDTHESGFEIAIMAATLEGPYDRLVSHFDIMFYYGPPTSFANLVRWLAPGG